MNKVVLILFGVLGINAIVLIVVGLQKIRSYPSPRPIYVTESDRDTPANLLDKKQDRNYVTILSKFPNVFQIQGVISNITSDSFSIWSQKNYKVTTNDKSVMECRDKFIKLADGSLALAYSTYLDLSRYIATLQINREMYIKQGKIFLFKDSYRKIESDSWVTGVFQERDGKDKKYLLDALLVYGCQ